MRDPGRLEGNLFDLRHRLAFAGLRETWRAPDGASVETFTVLTTTANDRVRPYHDRMPVIIAPPDFATWLDAARPPAEVERLFGPAPAASLGDAGVRLRQRRYTRP